MIGGSRIDNVNNEKSNVQLVFRAVILQVCYLIIKSV